MSKTVAVTMSTYNEEISWIRSSVESVLNQTYTDIHLYIVLDNPDNTEIKECIEKYAVADPRITILYNDKNLGIVPSLNKLIRAVTEEYVARLDADDIADARRIEKQMEFMREYQLDFVMCGARFIDEQGNVYDGDKIPMLLTEDIRKIARYGNPSIHSSWLLKKQVYDSEGGYHEVKYCEDFEFFLRALQNGARIGRMSECLITYRLRGSSVSMRNAKEQYEKAQFLRSLYVAGKPLAQLNCKKLNEKLSGYSEQEMNRFAQAKQMIDDFCNYFYEKKYLKCIRITIRGFITNPDYRNQFLRALKANIKMQQIYKSLSYL